MFRQNSSSTLWICTASGSSLYPVHFSSPFSTITPARSLHCISGACNATQNCNSPPSVRWSVLLRSGTTAIQRSFGEALTSLNGLSPAVLEEQTQMSLCRCRFVGYKKKKKKGTKHNHALFPKGKKKGLAIHFSNREVPFFAGSYRFFTFKTMSRDGILNFLTQKHSAAQEPSWGLQLCSRLGFFGHSIWSNFTSLNSHRGHCARHWLT